MSTAHTPPTEALELALIHRAARFLELQIDPEVVDRDASLLGMGLLDSLELAEVVITFEEELGVAILDGGDIEAVDSVRKLARFILEEGDAARVGAFSARWS